MSQKELCLVCNKVVYFSERLQADKKVYHQACFACAHCKKKITLGNYSSLGDKLYCKPHFLELFKKEGKYNFNEKKEENSEEKKEEVKEEKKEEEKKEEKKEKQSVHKVLDKIKEEEKHKVEEKKDEEKKVQHTETKVVHQVKKELCLVCNKTVYYNERVQADNKVYHQNCFTCAHCKKKITLGNYSSLGDKLYCKPHFLELFKKEGKYNFEKKEGEESKQEEKKVEEKPKVEEVKKVEEKKEEKKVEEKPKVEEKKQEEVKQEEKKEEEKQSANKFVSELSSVNTKNFNKVTDDMKTKNQNVSKVVKEDSIKKVKKESRIKGERKVELEKEQKWSVVNIDGDKMVEINITEQKQTVYIFKVDNSNIIVKGKCTSITIDDCHKSCLVFDDVISSCEVVNCKSVKVQTTGKIPTFNVDKTDGIVVYLSKDSIEATVITSKSSEMNVSVPNENEEEDNIELPIPEQFITKYDHNKKKFITESNKSHF